jgi:hypothetical protein
MRQSFRLLVTGSRTWDDDAVIEHALAAVLARHPRESSLSVGPALAEPMPSPSPTPHGPWASRSRLILLTGTATAGLDSAPARKTGPNRNVGGSVTRHRAEARADLLAER